MHKQYTREVVYGREPVAELLRSGKTTDCVYIQKGAAGSLGGVIAAARQAGVPIKDVAPPKLEEVCQGGVHQGVAALVSAAEYSELEDIFVRAGESAPLIVIADRIEDPHNLGAIIRTAEGAGAHGVIIPKRRGVGLTGIVAKASAGAVNHLPVVRVTNMAESIKALKTRGIWVFGADMSGRPMGEVDFSGPAALVLGGEGDGISRLVRENCDVLVSLPMRGQISSLNVSVAAGILLYEMAKTR